MNEPRLPEQLLRITNVQARTGLSRASVWRLVRDATFPAPVRIGRRAVAWLDTEIDSWIADCVKARNTSLRLRGRHPGGAPGLSNEEIALDNYLQQASYGVAFDESCEEKPVIHRSQEDYAIGSRSGRGFSVPAREKGRR